MRRRAFLSLASAPLALPQALEPGFKPLFDGLSLHGWRVIDGPESAFYVDNGDIVVHPGSNYPTYLRSAQRFENFDFRGEFFVKGWTDSAIYLHTPEYGRAPYAGFNIKLFHQLEEKPTPFSGGAIFPLVAPKATPVKNKGEWNSFRIVFDWPRLQVWINDTPVQDFDVESHPELKHRLRRGYLGLESLSYPIRFRNLRIKELAPKENFQALYTKPSDLDLWSVTEGKPVVQTVGRNLRLEGLGHIGTKAQFQDFRFQCYIRTSRWHNGGVIFRSSGGGTRAKRHYEIQLHNVEGAHFPTGSLYHFKRATYPRIEDEKWFLYQMNVQGRNLIVRINGETVLDYDQLEDTAAGMIELQAHHAGTWAEFQEVLVQPL